MSEFEQVTFDQMQDTLRRITYKPSVVLAVDEWRDEFIYMQYRITARITAPDARTAGHPIRTFTAYWVQPWPKSLEIFVLQIHSIIQKIEEHEADEWFRLDGEAVFDPHANLARSVSLDNIGKILNRPARNRVSYWSLPDVPPSDL